VASAISGLYHLYSFFLVVIYIHVTPTFSSSVALNIYI
jgi:hypothetical protein